MHSLSKLLFLCLIKWSLTSILNKEDEMLRVQSLDQVNGAKYYFLDSLGLIESAGYPAESHTVTTEDGYHIEMFRIPASSSSPPAAGKPAVFIMPVLMSSSDIFIISSHKSIAFMLADAGYDVWLGNIRGNTYALSHETLSPDDPSFWNFTYHETAVWDLPAMIDYILNYTNQTDLNYIGYSMGGTTMIILLSERPEYNKKINLAMFWAPTSYWVVQSIARFGLRVFDFLQQFIDPTGISEILPHSNLIVKLIELCIKNNLLDLCLLPIQLGLGPDMQQMNQSEMVQFANYFPAGTSTKTVAIYIQAYKSGKFRQFDYGSEEDNLKHYGKAAPPDYDVTKIEAPFHIFYGKNDFLCSYKDLKALISRLRNKVTVEPVKYEFFNHLDFVTAIDVKTFLYQRAVQVFCDYNYSNCSHNN